MNLTTPADLPIAARRDEIVAAIAERQVLIIAGDTGSGKTTQLPKMCLEAGRGRNGLIGCTQPRRIAAVSVAERVAQETGTPGRVGYKIRFRDQTTPDTLIKFMTDGVLLAETRQDRLLHRYDTLIIDEAHERSLNIDFLLGYLKTLLPRRPELKLLISSATLDTEKFSAHFAAAPVITVSGRAYPVAITHRFPSDDDGGDESHVEQAAREAVALCARHPVGDMLIFMPTERDILDCTELLRAKLGDAANVLPLFGRLHAADQRRIFHPSRERKIIVATNIAETSLTVPGIRYVIDSGLARISRYNPRAGTTSLLVAKVSRASCDQRTGRCGRTGPGLCLRLYSEEDYLERPAFTQPEIQRANLAEVILQMISLGLGDPRHFPFLDPPSSQAIRDGYRLLAELGAITADNRLTPRGRIMAGLPLDPCIARIIVEAAHLGAQREVKVIAAGLSIQDPRIRPADSAGKADAAHEAFADRKSDFLTLLHIWDTFQATAGKVRSQARLRKFCTSHFLSWQRMREWLDIHDQIHELTRHHPSFADNREPASFAAVHQALLSGFLRHIGQKKEKNLYQISGGREVMLFPGSALYNHGGAWMVCASFLETGRLYAMNAATVDVRWLEQLGGELCRRSWSDPHWEKKVGQVVALEKVTLFGLVIVAGRRVNYGRIGPAAATEARTIFIRQALAGGELGGNFPFLRDNLALIRQYQEMEARIRRRDIVVAEEMIVNFYDQRLGPVYDRHTLILDIRRHRGDRYLRLDLADICLAVPAAEELYRFPETLQVGGHTLALTYRFEPGHEGDGVTASLPFSLLDVLPPAVFEWLVPGLLEEKVAALLKSLPKSLRRRLVPLPDSTARITDQLELYQGSLYAALERVIFKLYQVKITRMDWQPEKLPPHLKMRFVLTDDHGQVLHAGRSFQDQAALARRGISGEEKGRKQAPPMAPPPQQISAWDLATPPAAVSAQEGSAGSGFLHPALFVDGKRGTVELRYIPDLAESRRRNRDGLRFLAGREFTQEVNGLSRECKAAVTSHTASWLALGTGLPAAELRQRLLAFLLDHLFAIPQDTLPSAREFTAALAAAREMGLTRAGRQMLAHLLRLLSLRREILNRLQPGPEKPGREQPRAAEMRAEMQGLLEELLPSNFLDTRGYADLAHTERYLKALAVRIERAVLAPGKDQRKAEQIVPALRPLAGFSDSVGLLPPECSRRLAEYRQMVEELRVSVFAPELGTAQPVSLKRLREKWQEVENACRRVE